MKISLEKSKELPKINISLSKAKFEKLFYFVVTGVIYHHKLKKCLILQRSKKEATHPGLWGVIGGKLEWDDLKNDPVTRQNFDILDWEGMIEKLLFREAKEECSLEVYDPRYLASVAYLRTDGIPTICCKFAVKRKMGKVKLAPEFDNFAWVDEKEVRKYQCIQGISEEVAKTIKIYLDKMYI